MFTDFPNLHPLVVHFPIVLILLSAALQAVLVFKDWPPVRWITLVIMAGGFAGALAASTVFHAMPMGLSPKATGVFSAHEQYASYALWLSGITLLLGGVGEFFQLRRRAFEVLVLVSALAAAGAVSVAGHHGAQLVYIAGVGPQGHLVMKGDHHEHGAAGAMPGIAMEANGHGEKKGDNHHDEATPATSGQPANAEKPVSNQMEGMDMGGSAPAPAAKSNNRRPESMSGMANMNMSDKSSSGSQQPTPRKSFRNDMPAMKPKKQPSNGMVDMKGINTKGMDNMPGMDMKAKPSPRAKQSMPAMPGMDMQQGKGKQPANSDMGAMKGMPGMEKGQAMSGMGSMPGVSRLASPMDKFRFEDNNPARNKSKNDKP